MTDSLSLFLFKQTFSFCRYPFVFDAEAKTTLLQTDAVMQMQVCQKTNYKKFRLYNTINVPFIQTWSLTWIHDIFKGSGTFYFHFIPSCPIPFQGDCVFVWILICYSPNGAFKVQYKWMIKWINERMNE